MVAMFTTGYSGFYGNYMLLRLLWLLHVTIVAMVSTGYYGCYGYYRLLWLLQITMVTVVTTGYYCL